MKSSVKQVSLREKIGSMLMFGFNGAKYSDNGVREIIQDIRTYNLAGVILFGYNIISPKQLKALTKLFKGVSANLFIAVDQEGGLVQRLNTKKGFTDASSAKNIAENYTPKQAYELYENMAIMLKNNGINFNFAPCVDIDTIPQCSVIGALERSFGRDPNQVIEYSRQFINAHKKHNIITTLKHFPGHGFAKNDTHRGLTDTTDSANTDLELKPYKNLLSDSLYTTVMTSHIVNRNLDEDGNPATLSKKIITGILKENLGFQGVVITDALEMGAIRNYYSLKDVVHRSIDAGNDILVFARNSASSINSEDDDSWKITPKKIVDIIEHGVLNGTISQSRVEESYLRVMKLKNLVNSEDNCMDAHYFDNGDMCIKLQEL
jgi:beta-N-acetylhexosaminidase